ncbi:MAG: hypothetical protein JRG79_17655 [Deltaproteobacteria bacterium]|nr:hypothetical protein [Deltaproteobacteria bacterium]
MEGLVVTAAGLFALLAGLLRFSLVTQDIPLLSGTTGANLPSFSKTQDKFAKSKEIPLGTSENILKTGGSH